MNHDPVSGESGADRDPSELAWPWGPGEPAGDPTPAPRAPRRARPPWAKKAGITAAAVVLAGGTFGIVWAVTAGSGGSSSASSTPVSSGQSLSSGDPTQSLADPGQAATTGPGPGGPGLTGPGRFGFGFRGPFGGGGPDGQAHGQKPTPAMAGTVKNVNGSTIKITDALGFTRTIHTTSSTTYTRGGQSATSSAVTTGAQIAARGTVDSNGTDLDASKVTVQLPRVAGTVQSVSGSSFVVQGVDGAKHTVTTTSSTMFRTGRAQASIADVKQGVRVVAMGDRQSNGDLTATAVEIAPARPQMPGPPSAPPSNGTQSGNTT